MSKAIPQIQRYMTTAPHTIGDDQPLVTAHKVLREHHIRHLPVLRGGRIVGMLTERDLALVETLRGVDAATTTVADAMSQDVFTVRPSSPLDEVAEELAERKLGSAIVVDNGHVVGIVTTVDLCRALAELLRGRLHK